MSEFSRRISSIASICKTNIGARILWALPNGLAAFAFAFFAVTRFNLHFHMSFTAWIWGLTSAVFYFVAALVGLRYCMIETISYAIVVGGALIVAALVLHLSLFFAVAYFFPIGFTVSAAISGAEEEYQTAHPHESYHVY